HRGQSSDMLRKLTIEQHSFPLNAPFRISRGTKLVADVVSVTLSAAGHTGRGECVPYPRYGESTASVTAQIESVRDALCAGMGRDELLWRLPAGAARNAVDAALWDLAAKCSGIAVHAQLVHAATT